MSPPAAPLAPRGRPRLVVTTWEASPSALADVVLEAARAIDDAPGDGPRGDLVEARLDLLQRPPSPADLERLSASAPGRLLVTCRPGGSGTPAAEGDRGELLAAALRRGAVAVDVEHHADPLHPAVRLLRSDPSRVMLSWHGEREARPPLPDELARLAGDMAARGPAAVKLAVPVESAHEAWACLVPAGAEIPAEVAWAPVPLGPAGSGLRLLAGRPGPTTRRLADLCHVFHRRPLPGPDLGQVAWSEATTAHGFHEIDAGTRVFGIFGWPLLATWSPPLHGALFRADGLDATLVRLPVRGVAEVRRLVDALGLAGAAVTAPHKVAARELLEREDASVPRAEGVNTLRVEEGGRLAGAAFDGPAALAALESVLPVAGRRIVVLGAGGAARAIAAELARAGARLAIHARREDAARELALRWGGTHGSLSAVPAEADAIVNATSVGMAPDTAALPCSSDALGRAVVFDMVTTPPRTALLAAAERRGLTTVDGLSMLARQAAAQQRWWRAAWPTRVPEAPAEAMVETRLRELVAAREGGAAGD